MPYADNDGVQIHYRVEGEGPPLVLQHGFSESSVAVRGEPSGRIDVAVQHNALQLTYTWLPPGSTVSARGCQWVSLTRTRCHFGGARPWFRCCGCEKRAAKLYLVHGGAFACRRCLALSYRSQLESPWHRGIIKARKLRVQLGGGPSLLDPFPSRPPRMHRQTYNRMLAKAIAAQERVIALDLDWLRARGFMSNETGVEG
jgi:hypothetical protein